MFDISTGMKFLMVPLIFGFVSFILFFGVLSCIFLKRVIKSQKNRQQPILLDNAVVISKRTKITHQRIATTQVYHKVVKCYITFQLDNGIREEFLVTDKDYGIIMENDRGKLKYQGTDFISFVRE